MRALLSTHVATVAVAASYLTLGVASPGRARELWALYAVVTFLLAITNLLLERSRRR